jgi:hypothetical protein
MELGGSERPSVELQGLRLCANRVHAGRVADTLTQKLSGEKRCSRTPSSPHLPLYLPRGATCITDGSVPGSTLLFHLPFSRAHGSMARSIMIN